MTYQSKGIYRKDGKVGINKESPEAALDVDGGVKLGATLVEEEGILRWNHETKLPEFFDGVEWKTLSSNPGSVDFREYLTAIPKPYPRVAEVLPEIFKLEVFLGGPHTEYVATPIIAPTPSELAMELYIAEEDF